MPILGRLRKTQLISGPKVVPAFAGMIFFWAVFDGILIYVAPLIFSNAGLSNTELGIVLGSSSFFGAAFDLLLSRIVKNPHFRRFYLVFFIVCFSVPLILWQAATVPFFLLVMAMWGIYFDLLNFGNFDFVSRNFDKQRTTFAFSLIVVVKSLGYIIAPILSGLAVAERIDPRIFFLMWSMIAIAFLFFLSLVFFSRGQKLPPSIEKEDAEQQKSVSEEVMIWSKLLRLIWSPLIFTTLFAVYDSFFYTIGPLLAESYKEISPYNGLMIAAYWVPTFLVSMYTERLTKRFGKKRTAYVGLLFGVVPLVFFLFVSDPLVIMGLIFISAVFSSFSIPAISAAYTDYINEAHRYEEEIEAVSDFLTNLGYIIGPILAGVIADRVGYVSTFGVLGVVLIIVLLLLLKVTPKHIRISNRSIAR